MPALKIIQFDGVTLIAVEEPRILAAMKAFGYVWQEIDDPKRVDIVCADLEATFHRLVRLVQSPPGTPPPPSSKRSRSSAKRLKPVRRPSRDRGDDQVRLSV